MKKTISFKTETVQKYLSLYFMNDLVLPLKVISLLGAQFPFQLRMKGKCTIFPLSRKIVTKERTTASFMITTSTKITRESTTISHQVRSARQTTQCYSIQLKTKFSEKIFTMRSSEQLILMSSCLSLSLSLQFHRTTNHTIYSLHYFSTIYVTKPP